MNTSNMLLGLIAAIIVIVVFLALRWAQHRRTAASWRCPGCQRQSVADGYGSVACAACHHDFILDYRGRPVRNLTTAVAPPAVIWMLAAGFIIDRLVVDPTWLAALSLLLVLSFGTVQTIKACRRKKFMPDEPAA